MSGDEWFGDHSGRPRHRSPRIILLPFPRIGKDFVGFLDFLKLCLSFLPRIIRMVLLRQTPICLSYSLQTFCGSDS